MTIKPHQQRIQFVGRGDRARADFKALLDASAGSFIEFEAPDYVSIKAKVANASKKFDKVFVVQQMASGNVRVAVI